MIAYNEKPLTGYRLFIFVCALGLGNLTALSNVPGYTILSPHAAGSLQGVASSFTTWATTDHMIGIVLGLPIARWLGSRYGDYRVYGITFIIYAVISYLCTISLDVHFFVTMRFLLGLAGGVILPIGQALVLKEFPDKYRDYCVSFWAIISMIPFTLGVFMGGFYAEHFNWKSLFYSNIAIGFTIAGIIGSLLYGRAIKRKLYRFDTVGFILLSIVLIGIQTILNQGNDFNWFASPRLFLVSLVVIGALPAFIIWEYAEPRPTLDMRLFNNKNYLISTLCSVVGFLFIQGSLSVFVGQIHLLIGYSSDISGSIYLLMALLAIPTVSVIHKIVARIDLRYLASFNFIGFAVVFTWLGMFDKTAYFDQIVEPMAFFGFWLATFFAPLATMAIRGFDGEKAIRAAEELTMLRTAAGAFGITLQAVIQYRLTPLHQLDIADYFGGRRYAELDQLAFFTQNLIKNGIDETMAHRLAGQLIRQQSALQGLNDIFFSAAIAFILLAGIVWFAKPNIDNVTKYKHSSKLIQAEELGEQP